jgi:hypothetical protein
LLRHALTCRDQKGDGACKPGCSHFLPHPSLKMIDPAPGRCQIPCSGLGPSSRAGFRDSLLAKKKGQGRL